MGLVPDVFNRGDIQKLKGSVGIGHVRYSTTGGSKIENCQPLIVSSKSGLLPLPIMATLSIQKNSGLHLKKKEGSSSQILILRS